MKAKIAAAIALVVAGLGFLAEEIASHFGQLGGEAIVNGWHTHELQKRYHETAEELNRRTPMDAGNGIRLDSVDAANMTLTYHYTALDIPADIDAAGAAVKAQAKTNYCGGTTPFKNDGVAVAMKYVDASGNPVYDFRIAPGDC
jgi:hypothetical protein